MSSSAHVTLVPRLLGWGHEALPGDVHKAFEVALHAGTLPALVALVPRPPAAFLVLATLPPAVAGLLLERPIEARLGGTRGVAAGLLAGSAAMVAADALARPAGPIRATRPVATPWPSAPRRRSRCCRARRGWAWRSRPRGCGASTGAPRSRWRAARACR